MNQAEAHELVKQTFENDFDRQQFGEFINHLLKSADFSKHFTQSGSNVYRVSRDKVSSFERLAQFTDVDGKKIDVLIVNLRRDSTIERARTSLRNFAAEYLKSDRGIGKEAVLVAYAAKDDGSGYSPKTDWRFSYVTLETSLVKQESGRFKEEVSRLTPARRYSFIVGEGERTHTAQKQFAALLQSQSSPTLKQLEEAFSVEKVTKDFYDEYEKLFKRLEKEIQALRRKTKTLDEYLKENFIESADFAKKLLGQIVFLYFLQKKGWFGVPPDGKWGEGDKRYLRKLFDDRHEIAKSYSSYARKSKSFFHNVLEPLFYEALAYKRPNDLFAPFNAKVPFLNGGLFEPSYEYKKIFIDLPDELFSNRHKVKTEEEADGILDIFDRYNFTVNEAERLEREVAIDPEMLGNVFENLLVKEERGQSGTFYTPQVIVSYMCRQSLLNYLSTHLLEDSEQISVDKQELTLEDLKEFLLYADLYAEHEAFPTDRHEDKRFPASIKKAASEIDRLLRDVKVCDPAIGSGAFPVGLLQEIVRLRRALVPLWANKLLEELEEHYSSYALKLNAIENSIYGVDKEQSAVDIARLRLWLSLIVDEDDLKDDKSLPNLDYKIMQGNSLLDEYDGLPLVPKDFVHRATPKSFVPQEDKVALRDKLQREYFEEVRRGGKKSIKAARIFRDIDDLNRQIEKEKAKQGAANGQANFLAAESKTGALLDELNEIHRRIFDEKDKVRKNKLRLQAERLLLKYINSYLDEREANLEAEIAAAEDKLEAEIANVRRTLKKETETPQVARLRKILRGWEKALEDFTAKRIELKKLWQVKNDSKDEDTDLTKVQIAENITLRAKPFFLWELQFGEVFRREGVTDPAANGFDIVIANPPYIRQEKIKEYKAAFERNYQTYTGMADILVYFYEKAFNILREKGTLTFITSNKYFRAGYGEKLREFLSSHSAIKQIIDFGDAPVFEAAAYASIIVLRKEATQVSNETRVWTFPQNEKVENFEEGFNQLSFNLPQWELKAEGWRFEPPEVLRLLEELKSRGTPLGEYVEGKFYRGIITGFNDAFVVDRPTRNRLIREDKSSAELLKPLLRGRDIKRWQVESNNLYLIKIESSSNKEHSWSGKSAKRAENIFAEAYPAIHKHLANYRNELVRRDDKGVYFWELRACKYWDEFEQPKIAYPNICKRNEFAWDEEGFYTNQKAFIIPNTSKFLLGYLNSSVVNWLFDKLLTKLQNGFYEPSAIYMREFPIPFAEDWQNEIIEKLVDYILYLSKEDAAQHKLIINYFEAIINALVYELFLADELHAADKRFFEPLVLEFLPSLSEHPGGEIQAITEVFKSLSAREHDIRRNLYFLNELESVRIIEGKE
jgi:hypothetical protein